MKIITSIANSYNYSFTITNSESFNFIPADSLDFTTQSDVVVMFTDGNREVCTPIPITTDAIFEPDEIFTASLALPNPAPSFPPVRIDPELTTITIGNDDGRLLQTI